jgi:hypothetical protein
VHLRQEDSVHFASDEKQACTCRATGASGHVRREENVHLRRCTTGATRSFVSSDEKQTRTSRATQSKCALLERGEQVFVCGKKKSRTYDGALLERRGAIVRLWSDDKQARIPRATRNKRGDPGQASLRARPGPAIGGWRAATNHHAPPASLQHRGARAFTPRVEWQSGGRGRPRCPYRNHDRARPWPVPALAIVASRQ